MADINTDYEAILEALNDKLDRDLNNIPTASKQIIMNWGRLRQE